jgi:hypothetical protein
LNDYLDLLPKNVDDDEDEENNDELNEEEEEGMKLIYFIFHRNAKKLLYSNHCQYLMHL